MNRFDKLLSYIYPITIEYTSSAVSPILEVVFRDGRYQLNSTNVNYSYGGLYELFKLIFRNVYIDWKNINNVLILGFGTGCTVPLIRNYNSECKIVGVEIDEKIIEFGEKYFDTDKLTNTTVICDSALNFITNTNQKFDLVIIDVYVDTKVPEELETQIFLGNLKQTLNMNGVVIFNKLLYSNDVKHQIPELKNLYQEVFGEVDIHTFMHTGKIFVAKNKKL